MACTVIVGRDLRTVEALHVVRSMMYGTHVLDLAQPDARVRERNPGTQKNVDARLCACAEHATVCLQRHSTVLIPAQPTVSAETAPPRRAAAALAAGQQPQPF